MLSLITAESEGAEILRRRMPEVSEEEFNSDLFNLAQMLKVTIYQSGGLVGLAANQVGVEKRVMAVVRDVTGIIQVMINPFISSTSPERATEPEGCGSLPGIRVDVSRPVKIQAQWTDITGNAHDTEMSGFEARIFQHELDHLDGKLITDYGPGYTS